MPSEDGVRRPRRRTLRRALSSAASSSKRSTSSSRETPTEVNVVATGYLRVNSDLPPLSPTTDAHAMGNSPSKGDGADAAGARSAISTLGRKIEKQRQAPTPVANGPSRNPSTSTSSYMMSSDSSASSSSSLLSPSTNGINRSSSSASSGFSSSPGSSRKTTPNSSFLFSDSGPSASFKVPSNRRQRSSSASSSPTTEVRDRKTEEVNLEEYLEEELTCAICLERLHRPKLLPCKHTFCLLCLQNYVNTCRTSFTCPSCRGAVQLPAEGVLGLPTDMSVLSQLRTLRGITGESTSHVSRQCHGCGRGPSVGVSPCEHCGRSWCNACAPAHVSTVAEELPKMKELLAAATDTLSFHLEEAETKYNKLEENIKIVIDEKVNDIQEKGLELNTQVQAMRSRDKQKTNQIKEDIEKVLSRLSSLPSSGDGTTEDNLEKIGHCHRQISRLLKSAQNNKRPRVTLDQTSLALSCAGSPVCPASSGSGDEVGLEHKEDEEDRPETPEDHSVIYRNKSSQSRLRLGQQLGERLAGLAVSPHTNEIYVTGSDSCKVFIFDQSGRQVGSFGSRGHGDGQFLCPIGIAFSLVSREIFVTDKWKHCINVFDTEGHFVRQLGRKGKGFGHFAAPEGIATDRNGRIYVADTCNDRVQILDNDGVFLKEMGIINSETLRDGHRYTKSEFTEPTGVAASLDGSKIYIADAGNHRVKVFTEEGTRVLMFGSRGQHKGQFDSPECIAVDQDGFILVGDSGNGRVQVFRPNGNFVRYFGTKSNKKGEFGWVSGIAISRTLDVVVSDFKKSRVSVF
ncbi:uncharacterized protein LOC143040014 isoform X2 [Oratosquilla oratoria]